MKTQGRVTFQQIFEEARGDAADAAFEGAKLASGLRRQEVRAGRYRSARQLSKLKVKGIQRALVIDPETKVTIDDDYQIGLLSIRRPGHGKLHLPADTQLVIPSRG